MPEPENEPMSPNAAKRRRPWLAAILSFLFLGLGQLYNGQLRRALVLLGFGLALNVMMIGLALFAIPRWFAGLVVLVALNLISIAVRVVAATKAFVDARRIKAIVPTPWNRWYTCAALAVATTLPAFVPVEDGVRTYSIPAASMAPGLQVGDLVLAERGAYVDRQPERGEIVVFVGPGGSDYVKRVVGLPGDTIQIIGGVLHLNGEPVSRRPLTGAERTDSTGARDMAAFYVEQLPGGRSYRIREASDDGPLDDTPEYVVPDGYYFVLGDNRDASQDSRTAAVGFVSGNSLKDRPRYIFWSRDFGRIGLSIE